MAVPMALLKSFKEQEKEHQASVVAADKKAVQDEKDREEKEAREDKLAAERVRRSGLIEAAGRFGRAQTILTGARVQRAGVLAASQTRLDIQGRL